MFHPPCMRIKSSAKTPMAEERYQEFRPTSRYLMLCHHHDCFKYRLFNAVGYTFGLKIYQYGRLTKWNKLLTPYIKLIKVNNIRKK